MQIPDFPKIPAETISRFKITFKDIGEYADVDDPGLKKVFDSIRWTAFQTLFELTKTYPNAPKIHFDFIVSDSLNAVASKDEDFEMYFIAMSTGTWFILLDVFHKILACNNTLPDVGNQADETSEKKLISLEINKKAKKSAKIDFIDYSASVPKNKARQDYAKFYADTAMMFINYHEYCHIIRGHVGYLVDKQITNKYEEKLSESIIETLGLNFCQTCEMDADSFAINRMLRYSSDAIKKEGEKSNGTVFYKNWEVVVFDLTFMIVILFRVFDLSFFKDKTTSAHPPPSTRISMILANIFTLFDGIYANTIDQKILIATVSKAHNEAHSAFDIITDYKFLMKYEAPDEGRGYVNKIRRNWNNVRPLIQPFAFTNLPPLVTD